jgi:hypothetical protein
MHMVMQPASETIGAMNDWENDLLLQGFSLQKIAGMRHPGFAYVGGEQVLPADPRDLKRLDPQSLLRNFPRIAHSLSLLPEQAQQQSIAIIRDVLGQLRQKHYVLTIESAAKEFIRHRALILQWLEAEEYAGLLHDVFTNALERKAVGPASSLSLFAALNYVELQALVGRNHPLFTSLHAMISECDQWPVVHATTPIDFAPPAESVGARPFMQTDEIITLSSVLPSMRTDQRFGLCPADADHFFVSARGAKGAKYVFCQGHLIGSLVCHYETSDQPQWSFLGMRTVEFSSNRGAHNRFEGAHPVIEGGIYFIADQKTFDHVRDSKTSICHVDHLALMPARAARSQYAGSINGNRVTEDQYLAAIRTRRQQLESR